MVSAMSADVNENDMSGPNLLEVSSPDSGVTFSVDNDKFEIDTVGSASVLKLKDGMYLDHEGTDGMVTLMITATDAMDNPSMSTAVTINVGDVNEAPMISVMDSETPDGMTAAASIMENAAGVPVGEIMVSDYDMADADLSGMITVSDDRFEVSKDAEGGLWLKLKDGVSLDHETDPMVTVTVGVTDTGTNGMAMSASTDVVVTVGNVNEDPTISVVDSMTPDGMPARSNIPENQAGVPVGEIMISDPDMADAELGEDDLTLSGEHAMYFEVKTDDMGGIWLKLKDGVSLNYEEMSSVMVTVTVTDSGMATAMAMVTVTVGNVNEPPSISVENPMIAENTTGRVGTVTVTDNEEMRDITLDVEDIRVVGRDDFEVVEPTTGDYELRLTRALDFESDAVMKDDDFTGYVEVVLEVTDEGLNGSDPITTTQTIKVMVVNEDEAPTISVMDGMTPDGMPAVSSINENTNMDGDVPVGLITASDPENGAFGEDDVTVTGADAESFAVKADDEGMLWLMLKQGASADHEGDGSLMATLTVSDGNNAPATTDFTLTIMDVNEAPTASGTAMLFVDHDKDPKTPNEPVGDLPATFSWNVGEDDPYRIDVTKLFEDMDGDTLFDYSISGDKPEWLELTEQRVDGKSIIVLGGVPQPKHHAGYWEVELVATDQGGESGSFMLKIVADDGNDRITGITFADADGDNPFFEADVNENDMSGVVIGTFTADDPDNELHANGMTTWEVKGDSRFEIDAKTGVLMLSEGKYLNHEAMAGDEVTLTVTAIDGGNPEDKSMTRSFTVNIVDQNDAPKAGAVGNWWVTVDEDLNTRAEKGESDFIGKGSWLSFSLETVMKNAQGTVVRDDRPAFTDEDIVDKDTLTYSIVSGPDWLGIDASTGALFNKEGMAATETGVERVMVRATDKAGAMADAMFEIAVVVSDKNDSGAFTDNDNPDIKADEVDIPETAGAGTVVARFTVTDEDLPVGEIHPWGRLDVSIQAEAGIDALDQAATGVLPKPSTTDSFSLHMTGKQGDTASYEVRLTAAGAKRLDADVDGGDEVTLTIRAKDASIIGDVDIVSAAGAGMDITTVRFKIDDVNEAPEYMPDPGGTGSSTLIGANTPTSPLTFTVEQQDTTNTRIYLNLTKLFEDQDGRDDDDDISFTARLSQTPWLKFASFWNEEEERMQIGPQEWGHIRYGRDEKVGGDAANADIEWGSGINAPTDDTDIVLILDVDRTGSDPVPGSNPATTRPDPAEIGQDANGSIMITAMDDDNARSMTTIVVAVKDENLPARGDGVSVSDDTPGQGDRLTIRFNEDVDPDFTGTEAESDNPVLVVYTWMNAGADGTGDATVQESIDNSAYVVKQSDVGNMLKAEVKYYELYDDPDTPDVGFDLVMSDDGDQTLAALDDMSGTVRNRPDAAKYNGFSVTTAEDKLTISVVGLTDADGVPVGDDAPVYTWEYSVNGVGGWTAFDDGDTTTTGGTTVIGKDQQNNYVRVVITYTDEGGFKERIVSDSVKVGPLTDHDNNDETDMRAIDTKTAPTIDDGTSANTDSIPAGRILRLDGLDNTKVAKGSITVEWIVGGKTVHTGETYEVSAADRGNIKVKVTTKAEGGGLVSIVESVSRPLVAQPTPNSAPIVDPDASKIIDLGAAPEKDGVYKMLSGKVNMASLFEDVEGLASFAFGTPSGGFDTDQITVGALNLYPDLDGSRSDQILVVNEQNGEVEYHGTQAQDHGGSTTDGGGNFITMQLTATDKAGSEASTNVMLRIDAIATGIEVDDQEATAPTTKKPYALEADADGYAENAEALMEEIKVEADNRGVQKNPQVAAVINIQDANSGKHKYGQYDFKVVGDWEGVFEVVRHDKNDHSVATLRLATDEKLDFEAIKEDPGDDGHKSIIVHVQATPVDMANSGFKVETIGITVKVADDTSDNVTVTMPPATNKVPGLEDDEDNDQDDSTDSADDGDEDGGTPAGG